MEFYYTSSVANGLIGEDVIMQRCVEDMMEELESCQDD